MCFDGQWPVRVLSRWVRYEPHRNKSSLISTWWCGGGESFEAPMTDDSFSCHLIVLFFVFPRLGSFIITQTTLITHYHWTNSFIKMSSRRPVCIQYSSFAIENLWFQSQLFIFPAQDMIEVGMFARLTQWWACMFTFKIISFPQWHQHS